MKNSTHFKWVMFPALMIVFLIAWSCKDTSTEPIIETGEITGQLLDEQDIPIPNAIVQIFTEGSGIQGLIDKDTTDDEGYFTLENVPENDNNLQVRIDHEDFQSFVGKLSDLTKGGDRKNLGIKMQHDSNCTGVVIIKTLNYEEEEIPEVEVRLSKDGKKLRKAFTDENGNLVFENVCEGEYGIRLYKNNYEVIEDDFYVEEGDSIPLEFKLLGLDDDTCCNGVIYFEVRDSVTEDPIKNVKVRLWKDGSKVEQYTNEDGKVTFTDVCEGDFQISFLKEGYKGQEFNFEMDCNDTVEFSKLMYRYEQNDSCCNGIIRLIVKDSATNNAIEKAFVGLWKEGKKIQSGKTSSLGLIVFDGVCEGRYAIDINHEQYKEKEFIVELDCDDTIEISKELIKFEEDSCCDGSIEITVVDKESGEKLNGVQVRLWKNGDMIKKLITEEGKVRFNDLCEGGYGISIIHERYEVHEFELDLDCNQQFGELIAIKEKDEEQDSCCNGVVYVAPKDMETHELIRGALVKLYFGEKKIYQETVGEEPLMITNLCEGHYQFTFIAEGYKSAEEDFEIACDDTIEFPFFMQPVEKDSCCDGRIVIQARDAETEELINKAMVKLWKDGKLLASKKQEGEQVIFEGLCEGKYGVDIMHEEYENIEFLIELPCNETVEMTKFLTPNTEDCCNGKVTIAPKDKTDYLPIKGATVKLWKDGKMIAKKVVEESYVVFERLCEGGYGVDITHPDYKGIEFGFELGCDEITGMEKFLERDGEGCCNGIIYTVVADSSNNGKLKGVAAKLWKDGQKVGYTTTNEAGVAVFDDVCEGEQVITLEREGYKAREIHIDVGCDDTLEYHYKMLKKEGQDSCETAEVQVLVKDKETFEHLAGATVKIYDRNNNLIAEGTTNEDGYFYKSNLKAPNYYKFLATHEGYKAEDGALEWSKCEKKSIVLKLEKE